MFMPSQDMEKVVKSPDPRALAELEQKLLVRRRMGYRGDIGFYADSVTDEAERALLGHFKDEIASGEVVVVRIEKGLLYGAKEADVYNRIVTRLYPFKQRDIVVPEDLKQLVEPHLAGKYLDTPRTLEVRKQLGLDPKRHELENAPEYFQPKPRVYQSPEVPAGKRLTAGMKDGIMTLRSGDEVYWGAKHPKRGVK